MKSGRRRLRLALCAGVSLPSGPTVAAQQFVTDDAAIVDVRSCQLEGWHGEAASWILPACRIVGALEGTVGLGFVAADTGGRAREYVVQVKYLFQEAAVGRLGVGLVGGVGFDPLAQVGGGVNGGFIYVPVTLVLRRDAGMIHWNLGWRTARGENTALFPEDRLSHHALTWAVRIDLARWSASRTIIIGELFGEDRDRPEYQLGVRAILVRDRLLADLSWGGSTDTARRGAGWALGLAWTPPPLF